jgi:hypothetical protein
MLAGYVGVVGVFLTVSLGTSGWARFTFGLALALVTVVLSAFVFPAIQAPARAIGAATGVIIVVAGVYFAWSGASQARKNGTRDKTVTAVEATIQGAADAEAAWYQHPEQDHLATLERYYLPTRQGGTGIGEVLDQVKKFRSESCRWSRNAGHTISIEPSDVLTAGKIATVRTHENYHQPRICTGPTTPRAAAVDVHYVGTYKLIELEGRWLIQAIGVPFAP